MLVDEQCSASDQCLERDGDGDGEGRGGLAFDFAACNDVEVPALEALETVQRGHGDIRASALTRHIALPFSPYVLAEHVQRSRARMEVELVSVHVLFHTVGRVSHQAGDPVWSVFIFVPPRLSLPPRLILSSGCEERGRHTSYHRETVRQLSLRSGRNKSHTTPLYCTAAQSRFPT